MWINIRNAQMWNPSKNLIGFNKMHEKKKMSDRNLKLVVYGTFDVLGKTKRDFKHISIEHKTDKGYFKRVIILSEIGKEKLKRLIEKRNNKCE